MQVSQESNEEKINKVKNYLEAYQLNLKMMRMNKYEREFLLDRFSEEDTTLGEDVFLQARMLEIRRFVMSLDNSDAKLILYYHYIRGESVEHCAELMHLSRRTGFRLKKKALELAAEKYAC